MRIPRDLTGKELIKALGKLGYEVSRQSGSHIRLTTSLNGTHHITIPDHRPIRWAPWQASWVILQLITR